MSYFRPHTRSECSSSTFQCDSEPPTSCSTCWVSWYDGGSGSASSPLPRATWRIQVQPFYTNTSCSLHNQWLEATQPSHHSATVGPFCWTFVLPPKINVTKLPPQTEKLGKASKKTGLAQALGEMCSAFCLCFLMLTFSGFDIFPFKSFQSRLFYHLITIKNWIIYSGYLVPVQLQMSYSLPAPSQVQEDKRVSTLLQMMTCVSCPGVEKMTCLTICSR